MISHKKYMELALKLAEKGKGLTSPNPCVGCIIVKRGKIVGRGYHKKAGTEHAEIIALNDAGKKAQNATLYVTLEPCSHWGKTPPCTDKIVDAGIREVIIGTKDPNPVVSGFLALKSRRLKVKIGILEEKAQKLNEFYNKFIKTGTPYVIMKVAMTLDGKIATSTGDSKWITSLEARKFAHKLRTGVDAVMVGINTVIKDNPMLTPRHFKGKDPIKIVVDSSLKIPRTSNLMKNPGLLWVATTSKAPKKKIDEFTGKGVTVLVTKSKDGFVDLKELMKELAKRGVTSILLEGGAKIYSSAIKEKIIDKVIIVTAPKLVGNGIAAIGNLGIKKIDKAINLKNPVCSKLGKDMMIEGTL